MTFLQALDACFRNNERITRPDWGGKYGYVDDGILKINWLAEGIHDWVISEGDFFANDWSVLGSGHGA